MNFKPRQYQQEAIDSAIAFFNGKRKYHAITILPTGSGKSIVIANIAAGLEGKTIVFQPSKEILEQNYAKFTSYGYRAGIYSASAGMKFIDKVTFATIGSVAKKHHLFKEFRNIIIDECHLTNSKGGMYHDFIHALEGCKVLGLTATPYRLTSGMDGAMLKFLTRTRPRIFSDVLYLVQNDVLFNNGYLAKLEYFSFNVIDRKMLQMNSTGTDFTEASLKSYYKKIDFPKVTAYWANRLLAKRKNLLVFCALVDDAMQAARLIDGAVVLTGETDKKQREKILCDFKANRIKCLLNVGVLTCLSSDTEVLTSNRGWVGMNDISSDDLVAQYDKGQITFETPKAIHKQIKDTKMVSVNGRYVSFNVTEDHDMLFKTSSNSHLQKVKASEIVNKKGFIPVSGYAKPCYLEVEQEKLPTKGRFIAQNKYNYKKKGLSELEAIDLANELWQAKSNRKYLAPYELTLDQCRFIGFWLGDGSAWKSKDGGIRYSLCQSLSTPKMIEWIEQVLQNCSINYSCRDYEGGIKEVVGRTCNTNDYRTYSLNKGTGGHKQKKEGLYSLIPYLNKKGTELFWGFNSEQFFALMEGLFKADGWHSDSKEYKGGKIIGEYKCLFDLLQAIGVCRGYRITVKPVKKRVTNKKQLYSISLFKKTQHQLTNERAQITNEAQLQPVWCVTMNKGNIVTRLNGTVTIMGNCGFDYPELEAVMLARSTMSLALYYQIIGRVMRPHPNKTSGWVVDLGNNIPFFGKIETMKVVENKGLYSVMNNGRHLTNTAFKK